MRWQAPPLSQLLLSWDPRLGPTTAKEAATVTCPARALGDSLGSEPLTPGHPVVLLCWGMPRSRGATFLRMPKGILHPAQGGTGEARKCQWERRDKVLTIGTFPAVGRNSLSEWLPSMTHTHRSSFLREQHSLRVMTRQETPRAAYGWLTWLPSLTVWLCPNPPAQRAPSRSPRIKPLAAWIALWTWGNQGLHWPARPGGAEEGHSGRRWSNVSPTLGLGEPQDCPFATNPR